MQKTAMACSGWAGSRGPASRVDSCFTTATQCCPSTASKTSWPRRWKNSGADRSATNLASVGARSQANTRLSKPETRNRRVSNPIPPQNRLRPQPHLHHPRPRRPMIIPNRRATRAPDSLDEISRQIHRFMNMPVQRQIRLPLLDERAQSPRADMLALPVEVAHRPERWRMGDEYQAVLVQSIGQRVQVFLDRRLIQHRLQRMRHQLITLADHPLHPRIRPPAEIEIPTQIPPLPALEPERRRRHRAVPDDRKATLGNERLPIDQPKRHPVALLIDHEIPIRPKVIVAQDQQHLQSIWIDLLPKQRKQ